MNKIKILALLMSMVLLVSSTIIIKAETNLPYTDIDNSHWASLYAEKFYELGVDSGVEGGYFYPQHYSLRGESCNLLYRFARVIGIADSPYVPKKGNNSYTDLKKGEWYYDGMMWCIDNELLYIPEGVSEIEPLKAMNRAETAYLVVNFLKKVGIEMPDSDSGSDGYTDADSIPDWAAEAVEEMVRIGFLLPGALGEFDPEAYVTRAGVLSFLYKMLPFTENVKAIEKAEAIPRDVHREVVKKGHDATCTEDGLEDAVWCDVCTYVTDWQTIIPATGHQDDGNYYISRYETAELPGERFQLCGTCGEVMLVEEFRHIINYTDVKESDWFFYSVKFVDLFSFMNGTSKYSFSPDTAMSRAMLITVLYRICGAPEVEGTVPFDDLQADQTWYHDAVVWAYQNNIVTGTSATKFSPTVSITREQLATVLYRFASELGIDVSKGADLSDFSDSGDTSAWAEDALEWAYGIGLITGVVKGDKVYLDPVGTASRAQVATVLMRFLSMEIGE